MNINQVNKVTKTDMYCDRTDKKFSKGLMGEGGLHHKYIHMYNKYLNNQGMPTCKTVPGMRVKIPFQWSFSETALASLSPGKPDYFSHSEKEVLSWCSKQFFLVLIYLLKVFLIYIIFDSFIFESASKHNFVRLSVCKYICLY